MADEYDPDDPDAEVTETKTEKKAKKKKEKQDKAKEQLKYKKILDTYEGRELIWDILSHTKVIGQAYVAGNPHGTSFNEGRRHEGLWLMNNIFTFYPASYSLMQQEATDREQIEKTGSRDPQKPKGKKK